MCRTVSAQRPDVSRRGTGHKEVSLSGGSDPVMRVNNRESESSSFRDTIDSVP